MKFIHENRARRVGAGLIWGVEPTCAVLSKHGCQIAPSTCYEKAGRAASRRALRDEELAPQVARVHADNYGVYGARKVWLQLTARVSRSPSHHRTGDESPAFAGCSPWPAVADHDQ